MLGEIVGGGVVGLVGTAITNFTEMRKQNQSNKHEIETSKIELEIIKKEVERGEKTQATIEEPTISPVQIAGIQESFIPSQNTVINFLRSSVRPVITYILLLYCLAIIWKMSGVIDAADNKVVLEIFRDSVATLQFLVVTVVTWWFGTRIKMKGK